MTAMNFKSDSTRLASPALAACALALMSFAGPAAAGLKCTHYTITSCMFDKNGEQTCVVTGGYDVCVATSDPGPVKAPSAKLALPGGTVSGTLPGTTTQTFQSKSVLSKR
jgi:hypothetical protein